VAGPILNSLLPLQLSEVKRATEVFISPATATALLTRRLRNGEETAFREFHDLYFDRLYRFLLVVSRGKDDEAREALQETLLRVARYVRQFETEEAFWSWLKVVARNAARDAGRKQTRYSALLRRFAVLWQHQSLQAVVEEEGCLRAVLEECLEELDPEDRALMEGKYLEEDTVKELSSKTGLTCKAVESRLLRLRRQLREQILNKLRGL